MQGTVRLRWAFASLVLVISGTTASAQSASTFVQLLNGRNLDGWVLENTDGNNFSVSGNVLRVEGPNGWLRSIRQYSNFLLKVEFRFLTEDADSGIFVRAPGPASNIFIRGWPANAYQVQARDISKNQTNNPLWIGNIYRHRVAQGETSFDSDAVTRAFKNTGEWQFFEIEAIGDVLTVRLNGTPVTRAANIVNPAGYIGVQGETGAVEYRSIEIQEK